MNQYEPLIKESQKLSKALSEGFLPDKLIATWEAALLIAETDFEKEADELREERAMYDYLRNELNP